MMLDRPRFEDALRLGVNTRRACADGRTLEDVAERLADALHRGLMRGEDGEPGTALVHLHVTQRCGQPGEPILALAGCSGFTLGVRSPVTRDQRVIPLEQPPRLLQAALPGRPDADDTRDCLGGLHVHVVTNARDIEIVPDQDFTIGADVRSVVTLAFDLPPDDRAILVLYARADLRIELDGPIRLLGLEIWRALLRVCGRRRSDGGSVRLPDGDSLATACRLQSQVSALRDLVRLHNEHVDQSVAAVAQQRAVADARERRLNAVLQALPDPIFSFRSDGDSFPLGQAHGATAGRLPDELAAVARSAIATGESQRLVIDEGDARREFRVVRVDQDEAICLARDISEFARAEYEVAEARNRTEFMASMSHEIRTPLNGVIGLLELLKRTPLAGEQAELIQTAERSAHHLLDLVSNILDLSRVESGATVLESTPMALRGFIEETLALIAVRAWDKGLGLEFAVAEGVPEFVSGDPLRLRQVLLNLAGNAIKFSASGTIRVGVAVAGPELLRFVVSDEGVGIPAHARATVFEAFRQAEDSTSRRYGGSGLGLALCKRYVELMGGAMELESEEGRGSSFSFTARLPAAAAPAVAPEVMRPDSVLPLPLRVLVAEDNAVNRLVLCRVLQNLGHAVRTVDDGRAAVEAARLEAFDLIFMDLEMPHLDGLGATRQIVAESRLDAPRVVAFTAFVTPEHHARCRSAGMADVLTKPIDVRKLEPLLASVGRAKARAAQAGAPVPSSPEPVLERAESLARLAGDESLWSALVGAMQREMPNLLRDLGRALDEHQPDQAGRAAHSLKGARFNIGARASAAEAAHIEHHVSEGRWSLARVSISRLELELGKLTMELRSVEAAR